MNRMVARFLFPLALLLAAFTLWVVLVGQAPHAEAFERDGAVIAPGHEASEPPSNEMGDPPQLD